VYQYPFAFDIGTVARVGAAAVGGGVCFNLMGTFPGARIRSLLLSLLCVGIT
jgi:hypothetical protein